MKKLVSNVIACGAFWLAGCGTYYDSSDSYVLGLRWNDRGRFDLAEREWKPLVEKKDPDAEFRYGWLLWTNTLGSNREIEAIDLFKRAAEQGQTKALLILADLHYQSPNNPIWQVKNPPFPKDIERALTLYLRAQKTAYYKPDQAALTHVLPKIKAEIQADRIRALEREANEWRPTLIGREPRRLL